MKRFCSYTAAALFFMAILLAGCSSAPAVRAEQYESGWTPILECEITHPTDFVGFLNEHFGVALGINGGISYSDDGGQTWTESGNSFRWRHCLDIVDENTAWCGGSERSVYMSRDGGKTWTAVNKINLIKDHISIDFIDDTTGWVATAYKLAGTNDGGQTWTEISLPEDADGVAAICLTAPESGCLLSCDGTFYLTADGGATWSGQDLGFKNYDIIDLNDQPKLKKSIPALADISFADGKNGTIVFTGKSSSGKGYHTWCLVTGDGGATWESELIPETGFTPSKVFLSGDGRYLTLSDSSNNAAVLKKKA